MSPDPSRQVPGSSGEVSPLPEPSCSTVSAALPSELSVVVLSVVELSVDVSAEAVSPEPSWVVSAAGFAPASSLLQPWTKKESRTVSSNAEAGRALLCDSKRSAMIYSTPDSIPNRHSRMVV